MSFDQPKTPSPEELSNIHKNRILSDAELVKDGAKVTPEGQIIATEEQIKKAYLEKPENFTEKNILDLDPNKTYLVAETVSENIFSFTEKATKNPGYPKFIKSENLLIERGEEICVRDKFSSLELLKGKGLKQQIEIIVMNAPIGKSRRIFIEKENLKDLKIRIAKERNF